MKLSRGDIYYINFPYTFDNQYPNGKPKFVVILQEGEYFNKYDAVTVLLITSKSNCKYFDTNVTIEKGTTNLTQESYIICAQPYTILKELFYKNATWCAGHLTPDKLDEIDEALYLGLCMGTQHRYNSEQYINENTNEL